MPPTVDLTVLPTGLMGWQAYVDTVQSSAPDDREERDFLEMKTHVDLTDKVWRARVAKFILGTANRDPRKAAPHLDGHAVMVLEGVPDSGGGVPAFDDKDLQREVSQYVGLDGPVWDYHRVSTDDGDVIVIVAAPPVPGSLWPCHRDGPGLVNGAVYLRPGAETRLANGAEVAAMRERVRTHRPDVEIDVTVEGHAWEPTYDHDRVRARISQIGDELRAAAPPSDHGLVSGFERRTVAQYHEEINHWEREAEAAIDTAVTLAASTLEPCVIRTRNRSSRWLSDPEIVVSLDAPGSAVLAQDWDYLDADDVFPKLPEHWNYNPVTSVTRAVSTYIPPSPPSATSASNAGRLEIAETSVDGGAKLRVRFDSLRPEDQVASDDDDVVLVVITPGVETEFGGSWTLTAENIDAVYSGGLTSTIAVEVVDITDRLLDLVDAIAG